MHSQLLSANKLACDTNTRRVNTLERNVVRARPVRQNLVIAQASKGKADPPDVPKSEGKGKGGREWFQSILSRFGPVREKASNTTVLDFEKPLVELDNRIKEVSVWWAWN